MRKTFLMLAIAGLVAGPTFADIGTVTMDIKVSDDGGTNYVDSLSYADASLVPTTLLVQIRVGATTSGLDGSNNGVQGLYFDLVGDALGTVAQTPLTLRNSFKGPWNGDSVSGNMGFDKFQSGGTFDPTNGGLVGIGAAQAAPPGPLSDDMVGANTSAAAGDKGQPFAFPIAFGDLDLIGATDGVDMSIDVLASATLWELNGNAQAAGMVNDSVLIEVLPEPATLMMLAPGLLLAMRRRRA